MPHLSRNRPEIVGQADPRLEPLQFVGRHRRKVDGVPHRAVAQEVADGQGRLEADQFLRFFGRRRDVRSADHLRKFGK